MKNLLYNSLINSDFLLLSDFKNKDALIQEIHSAHGERLKDTDGFLKRLAEKEAVIKILHNTCEERLSLIL